MKTTIKALFVLVIILIFSSCFSDWKGEATLTISFGGGNGRAAAWISGEEVAPEVMEKITHKITLSNGTDVIPLTVVGKGSVTETVAPGSWTVTIDALYDDDLPFATGTWKGEVTAGQENHADVEMNPTDYTFFAVGSFNEWGDAMELIIKEPAGKTCVIIVTKDFPANNYLTLSGSDIIIRGDHTVTLTGTGSLLNIWNRNVTLRDVKLKGNNSNTSQLVTVEGEGGFFTMEGSASVTGNTNNNGNCGGVAVHGGTFTMSGGSIAGNNAIISSNPNDQTRGGGVYVYNGIFNMSGGTIGGDKDGDANTAIQGGGVYVSTNSTFNMTGGSISGNEASAGGGVYVFEGSTFFMSNGEVSGNEAVAGGGVYVFDHSTFFMSVSAVISRNISDTMGGGVYLKDGEFTMSVGAVISGNATTGDLGSGGGVYVSGDNSIFEMTGGTIGGDKDVDANTAYIGGGVVVYERSTFDMSGGAISGNKSSATGGGVVINTSEFTMRGSAVISGNAVIGTNTTGIGGGVAVQNGTFNMIDGKINGNTVTGAPSSGGGVCLIYAAFFNMSGGIITGNFVTGIGDDINGAGVYHNSSGTFRVGGTAKIQGNLKPDSNGESNNVYLADAKSIVLGYHEAGNEMLPPKGMMIFVTTENSNNIIVAQLAEEGDKDYFRADNGNAVICQGDQLIINP